MRSAGKSTPLHAVFALMRQQTGIHIPQDARIYRADQVQCSSLVANLSALHVNEILGSATTPTGYILQTGKKPVAVEINDHTQDVRAYPLQPMAAGNPEFMQGLHHLEYIPKEHLLFSVK